MTATCPRGHLLADDGTCHPCNSAASGFSDDGAKSATIEETATGYALSIPEAGGLIRFRFDGLEERPHVLQAEVTTWPELPGMTREPFTARLNALSMSQRDQYRRQLDDMFDMGKGFWTRHLNRACQMIRQTHAESDPSLDLGTVAAGDLSPAYMAWPLAPADGPAVTFGPGGSLKTWQALLLAACVATGTDLLDHRVRQAGVMFLDYESTAGRIKARLLRILAGLGLDWDGLRFIYWPGRGRPLPEMVPALQRRIRQENIGLIAVDSAALACGGEPEKAEVALRYFNALAALEIPSVTVAHVTKQEEKEYPFGSVFWSNSARMTWNFQAEHDEGSNTAHIGLFNRKANEERLVAPFGVRAEFTPEAVRFSREELHVGLSDRANLTTRMRAALRPGACSVKQLAESLDTKEDLIRARLNQMDDAWRVGRADDGSGLWGLKANV